MWYEFCNDWNNYKRAYGRSQNRDGTDQEAITAAHSEAFQAVLYFIQQQVIVQKQVLQLSALRLIYINVLEEKGFPNSDYRHEQLMILDQ